MIGHRCRFVYSIMRIKNTGSILDYLASHGNWLLKRNWRERMVKASWLHSRYYFPIYSYRGTEENHTPQPILETDTFRTRIRHITTLHGIDTFMYLASI
jgi:hypothetical protein